MTLVVDTGALVALANAKDDHHRWMTALFETTSRRWLVPWSVLVETDYLIAERLGAAAEAAFLADVAAGVLAIEWGQEKDLVRADFLNRRYRDRRLGLTDAVVMAIAERVRAEAIVTLDLRHFAGVDLEGRPKLYPRDFANNH